MAYTFNPLSGNFDYYETGSGGGSGMAIGDTVTGATEGSILFSGASGVLAQDNAGLFWDAANDELGIGTNAPGSSITWGVSGTLLDVSAVGKVGSSGIVFHAGSAGQEAAFGLASGGGFYMDIAGHSTGGNNFIAFRTEESSSQYSPTERFRIASTVITSALDIIVPDEVYGSGWNGSTEVPTKNAVYDKIESLALGGGGNTRSINSISGNTTAGAASSTDYVYFVTGTTTVTMPTAVGNTNRYSIKNIGAATVTVAFNGAQTGDGSTTLSLLPNVSVDLVSDGSNFFIL